MLYVHYISVKLKKGFPGSSAGKESTCNAGDHSSTPGSGRSPGEGNNYPLQYSGLENSMEYPWGCKESDMTERLSLCTDYSAPTMHVDVCSVMSDSLQSRGL